MMRNIPNKLLMTKQCYAVTRVLLSCISESSLLRFTDFSTVTRNVKFDFPLITCLNYEKQIPKDVSPLLLI